MSQTAIRQVPERIDSQQLQEEEKAQTHKHLANIHVSLEKIALTLEQMNSAMQKIVEGP
jgi:hypothetical protein